MRSLCFAVLVPAALAAQPTLRDRAQMTVTIVDVRIGADEHGRSQLCDKLDETRRAGFPVVQGADGDALAVECRGRPARVLKLVVAPAVANPKGALCDYAAAPAGLAYDRIDWVSLRRGGLPMTGQEIRDRLEPLRVRTFAALLFAFGFERIDAHDAKGRSLVAAPLHQIDGFCAGA